jgi:hypothetical protein
LLNNILHQIGDFWDTHSLADYWEQTEAADFEIDPHARRRYLVALDPELLQRVHRLAQSRGLSDDSHRGLSSFLLPFPLQQVMFM